MTDQYWHDLAERWEALRVAGKVQWAPGMQARKDWRLVFRSESGRWMVANPAVRGGIAVGLEPLFPDLRDPATVGVLLSQWREACGDLGAQPVRDRGFSKRWRAVWHNTARPRYTLVVVTEPEAIIAALEALPDAP